MLSAPLPAGLRMAPGERWVLLAGAKRPGLCANDALNLVQRGVCDDAHTGTTVAIASVRGDPFAWLELWPVAFCLMPTLCANDPLGVTVRKPGVARGGVIEPATPENRLAGRRFGGSSFGDCR